MFRTADIRFESHIPDRLDLYSDFIRDAAKNMEIDISGKVIFF